MDDFRQIENLIYRYAELIDNGDLEGVAELFRNGAITSAEHSSKAAGYEEVLSLYQTSCRLYESTRTPQTKHLTTNVIIELEDTAHVANARSYFTVIQATESLPLQPIISGKYSDTFRKSHAGWEFSRREMLVELIGDCSAHLLYPTSTLK